MAAATTTTTTAAVAQAYGSIPDDAMSFEYSDGNI
jgi:hypothetical protein